MKGNQHKKLYSIDEFARKFYRDHARLNKLREDKKRAKKAARKNLKAETSE